MSNSKYLAFPRRIGSYHKANSLILLQLWSMSPSCTKPKELLKLIHLFQKKTLLHQRTMKSNLEFSRPSSQESSQSEKLNHIRYKKAHEGQWSNSMEWSTRTASSINWALW